MKFIQIVILLFVSNIIIAQKFSGDSDRKSVVQFTTHIGVLGKAAYFESTFEQKILSLGKNHGRVNLRASGQIWSAPGKRGLALIPAIGLVTGGKKHHFETYLGADISFERIVVDVIEDDVLLTVKGPRQTRLRPNIGVGYRYDRSDGRLLWRVGYDLSGTAFVGVGLKL